MCTLVLVAAVGLAAVPFVAHPFLDVAVRALADISAGAFLGSLIGVLVLVAGPVLLLGAVAPLRDPLFGPRGGAEGAHGRPPVRHSAAGPAARGVPRPPFPDPVRRPAPPVPRL